jgi:hypothetical protein
MKRTYRRASFRPTNSEFTRFVLIRDGSVPLAQRRYYTGDHSSRKAMWSKDKRQAMIYAHLTLLLFDLTTLQHGWLPGGRRGVVGWEPEDAESWDLE